MPYGVGLIGAGPGVASLHLPTLARLPELFRVVHVADAGSGRSAALAARTGARSSNGIVELLADPAVEVVAICSPPEQHAAHILAAVDAGVRGILCEKPLATGGADAEAAIAACRGARIPLIVGAHHAFDPAWGRATHHLFASGERVRDITVTLALPPNQRYHALVGEAPDGPPAEAAAGPPRLPDLSDPAIAATVVRRLVEGLAAHDLPLVRDLAPRFERMVFARALAPLGFALGFRASGIPVRMSALMLPAGADALWRVEVTTDTDLVSVSFPPSFVHAGSAEVSVISGADRSSTYPRDADDGYLAEWRALADLLAGVAAAEYDAVLDDLHYIEAVATAAHDLILEGGR